MASFPSKQVSVANTWVKLYTVPSTTVFSNISIDICNPAAENAIFDIAVSTSSTPGTVDLIESGITLISKGVYGRSCNYMYPGEAVFIRVNIANIPVRVSGIEYTA